MMKKVFFVFLVNLFMGCVQSVYNYTQYDVNMISETTLVISDEVIDISSLGWMKESELGEIMQPKLRNFENRTGRKTVLIRIGENIRYGRLWSLIYVINNICELNVQIAWTNKMLDVDTFLQTPCKFEDCYLIDETEIRSYNNLSNSFKYHDNHFARVARAAIADCKGEMLRCLKIRCSPWLTARNFFDFVAVAVEKGYVNFNLPIPLGKSVAESVRDYIDGTDGL